MFSLNTSTVFSTTPKPHQTPAVLARPATAREAQEMPRAEMQSPRNAPASPEEWTCECLFDCYND